MKVIYSNKHEICLQAENAVDAHELTIFSIFGIKEVKEEYGECGEFVGVKLIRGDKK